MDSPIYILGINSAYHESSACILRDGELIAFIEEERLNRKKHAKPALIDNADDLPIGSICYCLKEANITFNQINGIAYNFLPEERLENQINVDDGHLIIAESWGTPEGERIFFESNQRVLEKLEQVFHKELSSIFYRVRHHIAHASGTYYSSDYPSAAILVIDGIGESKSTWIGHGEGDKINQIYEIDYPNSLGFLWEKMSEFLGFSEYDAEKVMGLASYGDADEELSRMHMIVDTTEEGFFKINNDIILFRTGDFSKIEQTFNITRRRKEDDITQKHKNIAAALQRVTENIVLNLAKEVKKRTGETRLCMAGGTALNVVSNGKLAQSSIFNDIYIQPAANDAGGSIGAALYVHIHVMNNERPNSIRHAYYGPQYSNEEIASILAGTADSLKYEYIENITEKAARLLADGNLIAWFQGRLEMGPRALGHRSLLADPRHKDAMDWINSKVKKREYFRPLAPSVQAEYVKDWFEVGDKIPDPAKYMLMAFKAKKDKKHLIPAVVHVDDTSRIQSVYKEISPKYWELINEFRKITNIPMILNTSFNVQEPIICSPDDAIKTFMDSKIEYLILENFLCSRRI